MEQDDENDLNQVALILAGMMINIKCLMENEITTEAEQKNEFANHAIDAYDLIAKVYQRINDRVACNNTCLCEIIGQIENLKENLHTMQQQCAANSEHCEMLKRKCKVHRRDALELQEKLNSFEDDVDKARDNIRSAECTKRSLLFSSCILGVTIVGLPLALPLFFGAMGPAESSIDYAKKAKKEAEKLCKLQKEGLTAMICQLELTEKYEQSMKGEIERILIETIDQAMIIQEFRSNRNQLLTVQSQFEPCLRILKMLKERQSLLLLGIPAMNQANYRCIYLSLNHVLTALMPIDRLSIDFAGFDEKRGDVLPVVNANSFKALTIAPENFCNVSDVILSIPLAIVSLQELLVSDAITGCSSNEFSLGSEIMTTVFQCVRKTWNVISNVHVSVDGLNLIVENLNALFAHTGFQMLDNLSSDDNQINSLAFESFDTTMDHFLVVASVIRDKTKSIENDLRQCLSFYKHVVEMFLQKQYDFEKTIQEMNDLAERLQMDHTFIQEKVDDLTLKKGDIKERMENDEKDIHEKVAEVRLNGKLLAVDIGCELAMDAVLSFIPFMKAATVADEALVLGKYVCRKVSNYSPNLLAKLKSCFSRRDANDPKSYELARQAALRKVAIFREQGIVALFQEFLDDNGRLALRPTRADMFLKNMLKWFLQSLVDVPDSEELGQLITVCSTGIVICDQLIIAADKKLDVTTAEADSLADSVLQLIMAMKELLEQVDKMDVDKRQEETLPTRTEENPLKRVLNIITNGFSGCHARGKLQLVESASKKYCFEENKYQSLCREWNGETRKLHFNEVYLCLNEIDRNVENSKLDAVLKLQVILSVLVDVWSNVCSKFNSVEALLDCVSDRLSQIRMQPNSSMIARYIMYKQVFEALQMFELASNFTKSYSVVSHRFFLPMIDSFNNLLAYEGGDKDLLAIKRLELKEQLEKDVYEIETFLAIEESKGGVGESLILDNMQVTQSTTAIENYTL